VNLATFARADLLHSCSRDTLETFMLTRNLFDMHVQVDYPHLNRRPLSPTGSESADYERMAFCISSAIKQGEKRDRAFTCLFHSCARSCSACQSREPSPAHASTILKVELEIRREPLRTPRPPGLLPPRSSYLDSSTHRPFSKRLDRLCSRTKIIHEPEHNC
jgi:hypothetical protein